MQDLPYYFGFLLVGGMLMLAAGHYLNYQGENQEKKFHLFLSVAWTMVFSSLISLNYICQNTFVRHLALHYRPEYEAAISIFSMSNPLSLCWANEMWGYGFLGIATWLMAGYYQGKNNLVRRLLITNGIISLTGTFLTIVNVQWLMKTAGLITFILWNVLMVALCWLICRHAKKEHRKNAYKY